jgi:hypothetical protein
MQKFILFIFLAFIINIQAVTLSPGWNMVGSLTDNNINNYNTQCIDYIWKWDNNNKTWQFYSDYSFLDSIAQSQGLEKISVIGKEEGFWAKTSKYCNIDTTAVAQQIVVQDVNVTATTNKEVGIGLEGIAYWSSQWSTLDLFKRSSGWITTEFGGAWDTGETALLDLDENGWVKNYDGNHTYTQVISNVWLGKDGHFVDDEFVVTYDGEGTINYTIGCKKDDTKSVHGRDIIVPNNTTGDTCIVDIVSTDPNNNGKYIRNIKVIPNSGICGNDYFTLANDENECQNGDFRHFETLIGELDFHPKFLSDLKHFKAIRFMDWMNTYHNKAETFEDLNDENYYNWATTDLTSISQNIPIEIQTKLVNILQTDGWFNIPARMNDDGIKKIGQYLRDNVNSNSKIYVEYGNEVWNSAGPYAIQNDWIQAKAEEQFTNNTTDSGFTKKMNWMGYRNNEMCGILKEVFTEDDRLICVAGTQGANSWVGEQQLSCPLYGGGCHTNIDAIAIAPYFGIYLGQENVSGTVQNMSVDEAIIELKDGGIYENPWSPINATKDWDDLAYSIRQYYKIATAYGIKVIAYEGGQHLVGLGTAESNSAINNLFDDLNRDSKMGQLYKDYLDMWFENGGNLMMLFTDHGGYSKYGRWGLKEYQDQNSSAKFDAVKEYIEQTITE